MCGLVAAISKSTMGFSYKDDTIFTQMLYANALRGFDSTGIFGVNKYGNLDMLKSAEPAADFLRETDTRSFVSDIYQKYRIVVGHNRAATKGAVKDENAHPFIEEHICLVHNGTLYNHKKLKDVDVDSHAIAHALAERTPQEVIPSLDGAFALIWYDAKQQRVFITRNDERPLYLVETPKTDFIASEDAMLEWLLKRNGHTKIEVRYFKPNHLYSYDVLDPEAGFDVEELPQKKLVPTVGPKTTSLRLVNNTNTKHGGKNNTTVYEDYAYGAIVPLDLISTTYREGLAIMRGKTLCKSNVDWICTVPVNEAPQIANIDSFIGIVRGISYKDGVSTLLMRDVIPETYFMSCNDQLVSELVLLTHNDGNCDCCGTAHDYESGNPFWVRVKSGNVKTIYCKSCIASSNNLKHFLEKKTNE